ncbi:MAG: GNAT family N-acetyltransferase [Candidatus Binatia bacterium]
MPVVECRRLRPDDDRSRFRSGDPNLDRFFLRYAGQNQFRHHVGTTYVVVENVSIVGFATVSAANIEIQNLPLSARRRLPRYPLPVLRLARLAVDETHQGRGIGLQLLRCVFVLAHEMAERVGCVGVVVDAKPKAVDFYRRYGFETIEGLTGLLGDRPKPIPLFLPLAAISRAAGRLGPKIGG